MTLLSVTFSVFYDRKIIYILRLTRGGKSKHFKARETFAHFKMKVIKSAQNESDEIISK